MAAGPDGGVNLGNHLPNYFISGFKSPSTWVLEGTRQVWVQIQALSLIHWSTLGKLLNLWVSAPICTIRIKVATILLGCQED